MASQLQEIPLDKIDIGDGFNPRTDVLVDDDFVESIRAHGVLTPILVHPQGSGEHTRYFLVAGERRYRAATKVGLATVPAVIRTDFLNGNALPTALVENMHRAQLSPLDEARAFRRALDQGMSEEGLAHAVAVSRQTIRDRLGLLELPESVQAKVETRELTLAAARSLHTFAVAGEAIVDKVAELLTKEFDPWEDNVTPRDLERNPAWVLEFAIDDLEGADLPFLAAANGRGSFLSQPLPWPVDVDVAALEQKAKLLPEFEYSPRYSRPRVDAQQLSEDDLDAARSFGCVLVLQGDEDEGVWITDPVWLADRLAQKLDAAIEARAKTTKSKAVGTPGDAEKEAREKARKDDRQREQAKRLASRERNLRLGRELEKKLRAPAISVDGMRAIAELLLAYAGDDLGRAGLRFVDEASQTETRRKDGSLSKVTHLRTTTDCRNLVEQFVDRAGTAEEIYGALVQLIVATQYAHVNAAPPSDRFGELRGVRYSGRAKGLVAAIDNVAKAILPEDLRKKAARRR